jgi:hypothetical protein
MTTLILAFGAGFIVTAVLMSIGCGVAAAILGLIEALR